jgi:glyoxylase-like metal-dependent hydrolase (beta-lactamase superfamily II)
VRRALRALAAALPLVVACASPTAGPASTQASAPDGFLQIVEPVARGVHLMRQAQTNFAGVVGNVVIIEQDDSLVLVDSGSSYGDGARVVRAVRGLSAKPVSAVIVTHWHGDHPHGLAAVVEAWPDVSVISTEPTRAALAAGRTNAPIGARDPAWETARVAQIQGYVTQMANSAADQTLSQAEREGYARAHSAQLIRLGDAAGTYVVVPNRTFTDRLVLDDRRSPVEISFQGRANTNGDAIVWLPRQRVLIAGDTVVWPIPYNFNIFPAENIATLERLRAFDYAVLIPGHGEMQRDKSYLDLLIAFTRDVRAQVAPLAQGATLEQVTAQVTMESYAERFAGSDPWLRFWYQQYALGPMIESAYAEARGDPLGDPPLP